MLEDHNSTKEATQHPSAASAAACAGSQVCIQAAVTESRPPRLHWRVCSRVAVRVRPSTSGLCSG